jgi:hypothetical protein
LKSLLNKRSLQSLGLDLTSHVINQLSISKTGTAQIFLYNLKVVISLNGGNVELTQRQAQDIISQEKFLQHRGLDYHNLINRPYLPLYNGTKASTTRNPLYPNISPRVVDPRLIDPRLIDPRIMDPRLMDPRIQNSMKMSTNYYKYYNDWYSNGGTNRYSNNKTAPVSKYVSNYKQQIDKNKASSNPDLRARYNIKNGKLEPISNSKSNTNKDKPTTTISSNQNISTSIELLRKEEEVLILKDQLERLNKELNTKNTKIQSLLSEINQKNGTRRFKV